MLMMIILSMYWSTCINTLARIVNNIQSSMGTVELEEDEFEAADNYLVLLSQLLDCLREISVEWQAHFDQLQTNNSTTLPNDTSFQLSTSGPTGGPGRPRFNITKEQLQYLSSMSFSWSHIATLLGVSRMTVYRRRVEFGLLFDPEARISNDELISIVHSMRYEQPELGETLAWGRLSRDRAR